MQSKRNDTTAEVEFPEIEAKVAAAAAAGPLDRDGQLLLGQILIGVIQHDRLIQAAKAVALSEAEKDAIAEIETQLVVVFAAIAPAAVRMAEALTAMMPGFGQMTLERFSVADRADLVRPLFEQSGVGDRMRDSRQLS